MADRETPDSRLPVPRTVRQFWLLARETLSLRLLLLNRFVLILLLVVAASAGATAYAEANDEGTIEGTVVDSDGDPVANATVVLEKVNLKNKLVKQTQTTDADGQFRFTDASVLEFRIYARVDGQRTEIRRMHLLYPSQPKELTIVVPTA
jgi:hypothetical protein